MNKYAVIASDKAPAELPEHDTMWHFEKGDTPHIGLEYGAGSELPTLIGWTVLEGSEAFAEWLIMIEDGIIKP